MKQTFFFFFVRKRQKLKARILLCIRPWQGVTTSLEVQDPLRGGTERGQHPTSGSRGVFKTPSPGPAHSPAPARPRDLGLVTGGRAGKPWRARPARRAPHWAELPGTPPSPPPPPSPPGQRKGAGPELAGARRRGPRWTTSPCCRSARPPTTWRPVRATTRAARTATGPSPPRPRRRPTPTSSQVGPRLGGVHRAASRLSTALSRRRPAAGSYCSERPARPGLAPVAVNFVSEGLHLASRAHPQARSAQLEAGRTGAKGEGGREERRGEEEGRVARC